VVSLQAVAPHNRRKQAFSQLIPETANCAGIAQVYAMDATRDLTPDECQRYFQSATCQPVP